MPYRTKKHIPLPPDPLKEMYLRDVVKYAGDLNSLRMGHKITRREAEAKLWLILCAVVLMLWRIALDLINRQANTASELAELRKEMRRPPQSERASAARTGGFAA